MNNNNNNDYDNYDYIIKILMIGSTGVGKSSISTRFMESIFNKNTIQTIGVDLQVKTIQYNKERRYSYSNSYNTTTKKIKEFIGKESLKFHDIDFYVLLLHFYFRAYFAYSHLPMYFLLSSSPSS